MLSCLPLDPGFTGSNLAKDNGFLRVIQVYSMDSFGVEVKPLALCRQIFKKC
jgi:hypothetical protein